MQVDWRRFSVCCWKRCLYCYLAWLLWLIVVHMIQHWKLLRLWLLLLLLVVMICHYTQMLKGGSISLLVLHQFHHVPIHTCPCRSPKGGVNWNLLLLLTLKALPLCIPFLMQFLLPWVTHHCPLMLPVSHHILLSWNFLIPPTPTSNATFHKLEEFNNYALTIWKKIQLCYLLREKVTNFVSKVIWLLIEIRSGMIGS